MRDNGQGEVKDPANDKRLKQNRDGDGSMRDSDMERDDSDQAMDDPDMDESMQQAGDDDMPMSGEDDDVEEDDDMSGGARSGATPERDEDGRFKESN